jgi:hypothetical protein
MPRTTTLLSALRFLMLNASSRGRWPLGPGSPINVRLFPSMRLTEYGPGPGRTRMMSFWAAFWMAAGRSVKSVPGPLFASTTQTWFAAEAAVRVASIRPIERACRFIS